MICKQINYCISVTSYHVVAGVNIISRYNEFHTPSIEMGLSDKQHVCLSSIIIAMS